ncbi:MULTISPECIES: hypothetical protein [unclassified Streptomyces]
MRNPTTTATGPAGLFVRRPRRRVPHEPGPARRTPPPGRAPF